MKKIIFFIIFSYIYAQDPDDAVFNTPQEIDSEKENEIRDLELDQEGDCKLWKNTIDTFITNEGIIDINCETTVLEQNFKLIQEDDSKEFLKELLSEVADSFVIQFRLNKAYIYYKALNPRFPVEHVISYAYKLNNTKYKIKYYLTGCKRLDKEQYCRLVLNNKL